jgi:hypothetical protein
VIAISCKGCNRDLHLPPPPNRRESKVFTVIQVAV